MKVIIYTSTTCPACQQTKAYLTDQGHTYEERNISDPTHRKELLSLGFMAVPVTMHPSTKVAVAGFEPIALDEMILGVG